MTRPTLAIPLLIVALGGTGILVLVAHAISRGDRAAFTAAAALLVVVTLGAFASGAAYHVTRHWRGSGWGRTVISWTLISWSTVIPFIVLLREGPTLLGLPVSTVSRTNHLGADVAAVLLLASGVLFGLLMTEVTSHEDRAPFFVPIDGDLRSGTVLNWFTLLIAGAAFFAVLRPSLAPNVPETAADAAAVLNEAHVDARDRPANARAQLVYGIALMHLDRFDTAIVILNNAVRLDSTLSHPHNAIGWMLMRQKRFDEAIPHLRAAVQIDDDYGHAWHNLGWSLAQVNQRSEAVIAYENAARLIPNDASLRAEYSWVLFTTNRKDAALAEIRRAIQLDPRSVGYRVAGSRLLRATRRFDEAIVHLEAALKVDPAAAPLWGELGMTRYLMQDAKGAAAAFASAKRHDPAFFDKRPLLQAMYRSALRGSTADVMPDSEMIIGVPIQR